MLTAARFFSSSTARASSTAASIASHSREFTALVPYTKPAVDMVRWGHKFVTPMPWQTSGMEPGTIRDEVIPKGTRLLQWQPPGGVQGGWYTRTHVDPFSVGISPVGMTTVREHGPGGDGLPPLLLAEGKGVMHQEGGVLQKPVRKQATEFRVLADVPAIASRAKTIVDTWSLPGLNVATSGGAEQLLIPNRSRVGATV